jgi:hypothetical protein
VVPRANTTSTSGHGCANADETGALSDTQLATVAEPTNTAIRRAHTAHMLTHRDDGRDRKNQRLVNVG